MSDQPDPPPYPRAVRPKVQLTDAARNVVYTMVWDQLRNRGKPGIEYNLTPEDVLVVWFAKTLQNWKALVITTLPDELYYEVTFNGDKNEIYIDTYVKVENRVFAYQEEANPQPDDRIGDIVPPAQIPDYGGEMGPVRKI